MLITGGPTFSLGLELFLKEKDDVMKMSDSSQATGVPASQDRSPLEGRQ